MEYQTLGNSELHISRIGFGCMSLKPGQLNLVPLLQAAVNGGINLFDTADLYDKGLNEEQVGRALKPFRQKILLATKVGNQWRPDASGWTWNPRKSYILEAVEASLKRLQTDYLDLYQLHGGTIDDPIDETIEAFELLKKQGKIRAYGISSIRPNVIREYVSRSTICSVMMQCSLLDRRPMETSLPLLRQQGIGVLARGTVAGGLLTGKVAAPYLGYDAQQVNKASQLIQSLSNEHRSPAQTAIRYVLQQPGITAAIVGIRTESHLADALGLFNSPALTASELQQLDTCLPASAYSEHR